MSQIRAAAIVVVIAVTTAAAALYVKDMIVHDAGVKSVQECGRSIELRDSARDLAGKIESGACADLLPSNDVKADGQVRLVSEHTGFHEPWHLDVETKGGVVVAIRHRTKASPDQPPKNAPPDRVSGR
jgi:hypothetical protein